MFNDFRARLASGDRLDGTMLTLSSPSVAEILADAGFDWLFVDGEHGSFDTNNLQSVLQTVDHRIPCLVRVPAADEVWIKRTLDLGAAGVIVPQVNSAVMAEGVVQAARYAPQGARGVGLARAHRYGAGFQEYVEQANSQVTVVIQAEHIDAVNQIDAIVQVAGIDAVLLGPYDLAASMGHMGAIAHPEVLEAIERVTVACQNAGIPLGYFGVSVEAVRPYVERGYTLIIAGTDTIFLSSAAGRVRSALKDPPA